MKVGLLLPWAQRCLQKPEREGLGVALNPQRGGWSTMSASSAGPAASQWVLVTRQPSRAASRWQGQEEVPGQTPLPLPKALWKGSA